MKTSLIKVPYLMYIIVPWLFWQGNSILYFIMIWFDMLLRRKNVNDFLKSFSQVAVWIWVLLLRISKRCCLGIERSITPGSVPKVVGSNPVGVEILLGITFSQVCANTGKNAESSHYNRPQINVSKLFWYEARSPYSNRVRFKPWLWCIYHSLYFFPIVKRFFPHCVCWFGHCTRFYFHPYIFFQLLFRNCTQWNMTSVADSNQINFLLLIKCRLSFQSPFIVELNIVNNILNSSLKPVCV